MNNLTQRLITGLGLIVVISGSILVGPYSFVLLILFINGLGLLEFYRLFHLTGISSQKIGGLVLSSTYILIITWININGSDKRLLLIIIPIAFILLVIELYRKSDVPFQNLAFTFLGIICISIPLSLSVCIPFSPWQTKVYQPTIMLGYFFLLWASDSGAYVAGNWFGKNKLFERISPHKTWEGSLGGLISALLVAGLNTKFFNILSLSDWIIIALVVVVFGTYADLIKSMMKRSLKIKDSGTILPGHGGILDRFDSFLGSSPFVFLYLMLSRAE